MNCLCQNGKFIIWINGGPERSRTSDLRFKKPPACELTCANFFRPSVVRESTWKGAWIIPKKRFSIEQIVTLLRQIELSITRRNLRRELAGMRAYRCKTTR